MLPTGDVTRRQKMPAYFGAGIRSRRKRALTEATAIGDAATDLGDRLEDLRKRTAKIKRDVEGLEAEQDRADALSESSPASAELQEKLVELNLRSRAIATETEELEAEGKHLAMRMAQVESELSATGEVATRLVTQGTIFFQLVVVVVLLLLHPNSVVAHNVRLDYYNAVATVVPVLLVAGLVELALQARSGLWNVLAFVIPASGSGGAALVVLGTHRSTSISIFLTVWGLLQTFISLVIFVAVHAESSKDAQSAQRAVNELRRP